MSGTLVVKTVCRNCGRETVLSREEADHMLRSGIVPTCDACRGAAARIAGAGVGR